jgi:uncharacterized UPF0160 family protein
MEIIDISGVASAAVHDGTFHADDVFSIAILRMMNPTIKVIRSRNLEVLAQADIRIDVGGKHSPSTCDFDHHMTGGAGKRANGIPYAACGLIWKHFGRTLVRSDHVFEHIERKIIQTVDAIDSGYLISGIDTSTYYNIADAFDAFNPAWNDEDQNHDAAFMRAVEYAITVLSNEIRHSRAFESGRGFVLEAVARATDPRYVLLERYCPWQDVVVNETHALYVLFPAPTGDWRIRAVPDRMGSFAVRRPLPAHWGGLTREELAAVTGVEDALFCHQALFIAGAVSREGVLKMMELALR